MQIFTKYECAVLDASRDWTSQDKMQFYTQKPFIVTHFHFHISSNYNFKNVKFDTWLFVRFLFAVKWSLIMWYHMCCEIIKLNVGRDLWIF